MGNEVRTVSLMLAILKKLVSDVYVRRVVIIGNAPIVNSGPLQPKITASLLSRFIDSCDVIIRMNNIKNINSPGIGTRTDILAMMNTGAPAEGYAARKLTCAPILAHLRDIVFVVPPNDMKSLSDNPTDDPAHGRDFSSEIIIQQGWTDLKISFVRDAVIERLSASIAEFAGSRFMASTGARTIAHVLNDPRFFGYNIFIVGFGFEGPDCQKHICKNLVAAGKLRVVSKADVSLFSILLRSTYHYGRRLRKLLGGRCVTG